MPLKVTCDKCQKTLKAPDTFAGKRVRCPSCQSTVQLPSAESGWESELASPKSNAEPALKPKAEPSPVAEFDWSKPLEPAAEPSLNDQFDHFDELASLPATPRRKGPKSTEAPSDAEIAFRTQRGIEGHVKTARRNERSHRSKSVDREGLSENGGYHGHWLLGLALIPLMISVVAPGIPIQDRWADAFREHPEILAKIEHSGTLKELLFALPEGRLPGAHLARNTVIHWVYALASSTIFLTLMIVLFPRSQVRLVNLVLLGLLTGTVGILLLLGFQFAAELSQGIRLHGRSIVVLLFLIVQLIGFSYRCAMDGNTGFVLSFLGFTCGVGFCEELCKGIPVSIYLGSLRESNWRTACLIGLASGVGFGVSEGIMYSAEYYNGVAPGITYLVRFGSCVCLHAVWSSSAALLMNRNQDYLPFGAVAEFGWDTMFWFVVYYLGIVMVLHGLYDTLLKQDLDLAALAVALSSFVWWAWLLYKQRSSS